MNDNRVVNSKGGSQSALDAMLQKGAEEERSCRIAKREAQHDQWMKVMKEGQSTPDLSYQKVDQKTY